MSRVEIGLESLVPKLGCRNTVDETWTGAQKLGLVQQVWAKRPGKRKEAEVKKVEAPARGSG